MVPVRRMGILTGVGSLMEGDEGGCLCPLCPLCFYRYFRSCYPKHPTYPKFGLSISQLHISSHLPNNCKKISANGTIPMYSPHTTPAFLHVPHCHCRYVRLHQHLCANMCIYTRRLQKISVKPFAKISVKPFAKNQSKTSPKPGCCLENFAPFCIGCSTPEYSLLVESKISTCPFSIL